MLYDLIEKLPEGPFFSLLQASSVERCRWVVSNTEFQGEKQNMFSWHHISFSDALPSQSSISFLLCLPLPAELPV